MRPTPSEQRMAELCAIRRELTEDEIQEALTLAKRIRDNVARRKRNGHRPRAWPADRCAYFASYKNRRYANDPAFRETVRARVAAYKARRRAEARS